MTKYYDIFDLVIIGEGDEDKYRIFKFISGSNSNK